MEYEKEIVHLCDMSRGDFNPDDCLEDASSRGTQGILLVPDIEDRPIALEIIDANNSKLEIFGGDTLYYQGILTSHGQDATSANLVTAVSWHRGESKFDEDTISLFGTAEINWATAMSADALFAISSAASQIDLSSSIKQQRIALRDTLQYNQADGVTGPDSIEFDIKNDRVPTTDIGVLVKVEYISPNRYSYCRLEDLSRDCAAID